MTTPTNAPDITATTSAPAFGSVFGPTMAVTWFDGARWSHATSAPIDSFSLHPGTHALHYGSSCFEGLKAHPYPNGRFVAFRPEAHAARLVGSAARLHLPTPSVELVLELIDIAIRANEHVARVAEGALYLRPTLLGTDVTVGAAAAPSATAMLYVLACPVGDYLPSRPLTVAVETETPRTTPQFGVVKTGANYAMALSPIMDARERFAADQVLFAPDGRIEETGASNVILLDGEHLLTPALTDAYLHGITRDSLLALARRLGWQVEERDVTVTECIEWISRPTAELALTGTAATVASVGTLVIDGDAHRVGTPGSTPSTDQLRATLTDVQTGRTPFSWNSAAEADDGLID